MIGNSSSMFQISIKLLNRAMVLRTIPKQEDMVLLGDLSLTLCSESIEPVSLSNCGINGIDIMSFHEFVKIGNHYDRDGHVIKKVIPHYNGGIQYCKLPLSEVFCTPILLAYKPWTQ
jgi:hypothetical protein